MTEDFKRKLTAILSADVVGYSRLMGDDETATVKTLETYKGVMSSLIKQHRGRVVDSPGDNLLAEFGSVVDAVQCAVSIQKELQTRNADLPEDRRMEFRIGINLGDVIEEEDRIYGDGVNIAARLEALADPGGICISKTAFDYIENKLPFNYSFIGEQTVKNIAKPVGAYKVLMETRLIDEEEKKTKTPFWRRKAILSIGTIVILVIVAGLFWNSFLRRPSIEPASIERMALPLPDKPSIAVLPFTNNTGDPGQDYIGNGLSENINDALSVSSQMFVMDHNTTFTYKGTRVKHQQVAEELGVQYILDGSIQTSGDQLRVKTRLIDALSGHQLWSDKYDREMKDLFEIEDDITKKIMVSLQVKMSGSEEVRVYAKSTDNLEAWKRFIIGQELLNNYVEEDNARAREHFEAAFELDPMFVSALSGLAETHFRDFVFEWGNIPLTSMNLALDFAQKGVELDEQNSYAHEILGLVYLHQRQYEKAIEEEKQAIDLNPNFAYGYGVLGEILYYSGRFDEAISLTKKALRLNPLNPSIYLHNMAMCYYFLGRYEEALETIRQMEAYALPSSRMGALVKINYSRVYLGLGRDEKARAYMKEALKIKPDFSLDNWATDPYKDPAHLKRVLDALRKAGMPEHPPGAVKETPKTIAVLPFEDISPEKDQEYFVDGLSEEILNSLAQISNLGVTARTSSFAFKGTDKTIPEIANILVVDHILEGSVRKAGNKLRITAQLIRASDGLHLWSETYDRKLDDIFKIQEDIANNVAEKLKLTLEAFQLLGGTENIKAYELYVKARGISAENRVSRHQRALELLDKVIMLDPDFALAWAYKAHMHLLLNLTGPANRAIEEAEACLRAGQKAIEIEPNLGEAYIHLGWIKMSKGQWYDAEINYSKALKLLDNTLSGEHNNIFPFYLSVGKFKKAYEIIEKMRRNDPINQNFLGWYYIIYWLLGDRQKAEDEYQLISGSLSSNDWAHDAITQVRIGSGDVLSPDEIVSSNLIHNTGKEYLDSPEEGLVELRRIFSSDNNLSPYDLSRISLFAAYFGDYEFAMDALEKGTKISASILYCWAPIFHEARKTSRFKELMREIGLVEYWKEYGWPDLCNPVGDDDFECD